MSPARRTLKKPGASQPSARRGGRPASPGAPADAEDASTRERMLDAALAAFSELGFDGASTRAIAGRAGVNQGLIPYYFGSKEALWQAAVERAFGELAEALAEDDPAADEGEARERLIRRLVRFAARRPEFTRLMTDEGKRDTPRMHWIVDRHVRPIVESLRERLTSGSAFEGAPQDLDALQLHYAIVGAATHLFHQAPEYQRLSGSRVSDESLVRAQEDLMVALFARPGPPGPWKPSKPQAPKEGRKR